MTLPFAGPSRQCQRQACYLVVGLRLGLPKGSPGLRATGGRVGDLCGPASFSRPQDAPHPAQNSLSPQEALQETLCCPELLTSLNGTELCQRNSWREERARESEREGGREGQETGLAEGGGGQLCGVGASRGGWRPCQRGPGLWVVFGWPVARPTGNDPPLWQAEPS